MEQRQRGQRYLPVPPPLPRLSHREVVRERHVGDSRRGDSPLHGKRDGGYPPLLDGSAYQPNGPVAEGSRRRKQNGVHLVFGEPSRDFGGSAFYERIGIVDGPHKGEMPVI